MAVPVMPSTAQYGYVVGRFLLAVGDTSADPDTYPDAVVPSGKVIMRPVSSVKLFPGNNPPVTVLPQSIELTLDADGDIVDTAGNQGVWLIIGQYTVSFNFVGITYPDFIIEVTADNTAMNPVDLTLAAPLIPDPSVVFIVNQQVYDETIAAHDETIIARTAAVAAQSASESARDAAIAARDSTTSGLTSKAPLASPTFTGDPKAPTPVVGDNDTSIATTAFVATAITNLNLGNYAPLASPTFTGDPKAPTPATADNDTSIATTAFVKAQGYATLASPTLTGTPLAPTAAAATNTTQIATTAFVRGEIASLVNGAGTQLDTLKELADALGGDANFSATITAQIGLKAPSASPTFTGTVVAPTPATADSSTLVATTAFVKAQGYATLASPALSGTPTAPTPATTTNTTQIATTAMVQAAATLRMYFKGAWVASTTYAVNDVVIQSGNTYTCITANSDATFTPAKWQLIGVINAAPLASPAFTGTPTAPTPTVNDNTTKLATTAYVDKMTTRSYSQFAYVAGNQALLNDAFTTLVWDTVITDGLGVAYSGGAYTIPVTGRYEIHFRWMPQNYDQHFYIPTIYNITAGRDNFDQIGGYAGVIGGYSVQHRFMPTKYSTGDQFRIAMFKQGTTTQNLVTNPDLNQAAAPELFIQYLGPN